MIRKIEFYKDYFIDFYSKQNEKVQEKIEYVFNLIKQVERVPEKFLKHLSSTDGLYEIRIEYQSNIFRIFCFFDKGKLVILLNGFQKKTKKTPKNELEIAKRLKTEYFNEKEKQNGKL
jgi:phage-related protein